MSFEPQGSNTTSRPSPFFHTPPTAQADSLAILHLKRDSLLPVELRTTADDGYAEGAVTNTRFGSFPHTTLIGLEWGSQVRASKVDTGTRGRKNQQAKQASAGTSPATTTSQDHPPTSPKKRKSDTSPSSAHPTAKKPKPSRQPPAQDACPPKPAIEAGSGFIHLLPPTPESWTASLDHRTQVVYTPDYSYILQRLHVRPGSRVLEAGAGSGSFTHAAARAVFSGYPAASTPGCGSGSGSGSGFASAAGYGKVCSYEFHAPRVATLAAELAAHGLESVVELTHRDVCTSGFALPSSSSSSTTSSSQGTSPNVSAIFLDLPAPWLALPHLTRASSPSTLNPTSPSPSPLDPLLPIHICTFSPCIEQVTITIAALRRLGWKSISMREICARRLEVRRERVGLREEGLRGVNASAADVGEAVGRARVELAASSGRRSGRASSGAGGGASGGVGQVGVGIDMPKGTSKKARLDANVAAAATSRKIFKEGRLGWRTEGEVRTHTSWLVFAVLERAWSAEDERGVVEGKFGVEGMMGGGDGTGGRVEGGEMGG